ncbi:MAG TPA: GNAT family N-acetyltransferase [Usitatibacteraceae bacterium]|nr:GNAT family N-acetyltransferase [Usitatibacteraceae bacterium]
MSEGLVLESARLIIASPVAARAGAMRDFVVRNAGHLKPWSPPSPAGVETIEHWLEVVETAQQARLAGTLVRFWLSPRSEPGAVIGSVGFSQIARGPFCNCVMGYQLEAALEGQGLMREALSSAMQYMFDEQRLHRIAANYRPENTRSGRLLAHLGFNIEGYARDYLFIDGAWRDHILTSKVNPGFDAGWLAPRA